jgi:Late embryogenesis abundant protein
MKPITNVSPLRVPPFLSHHLQTSNSKMGDRAYATSGSAQNPLPAPPGRTVNGAATNGSAAPKPVPAVPPRVVPPYQYRPKPYPPSRSRYRSRRNWCCTCCLWFTLLLIGLVFLAAIAAGVLYVLYHPRKPTFNVTSLRLINLNVSSSSDLLSARLNFTVTARNPNQKISFSYGDVSISTFSGSVDLADGSIPAFMLDPNNVSIIPVSLSSSGRSIDPSEATDLMKKKTYPLEIELDTKAGVKIGKLRSFKIAIRVSCTGISVGVAKVVSMAPSPSPKSPPPPPPSIDAKCKPKIKILSWTF